MLHYKSFILLPNFETNTYLIWDDVSNHAMLIDPAAPSGNVLEYLSHNKLQVTHIINTHGHADHIGGNEFFKTNLCAPVYIHEYDSDMLENSMLNLSKLIYFDLSQPKADFVLVDGQSISLGIYSAQILHTPGHTIGSICIFIGSYLFSGDTLFYHDVGRWDLPGGSQSELTKSIINKLYILPDDTIVLPGHGPISKIKDEKLNNPYIRM